MKRKDFFKSLAALPFVAKAIADPMKPEELAAKEAEDKAKAGIRKGNKFESDFKEIRRSSNASKEITYYEAGHGQMASTSAAFWEQDTEAMFATTSLILKNPNKHGKIY